MRTLFYIVVTAALLTVCVAEAQARGGLGGYHAGGYNSGGYHSAGFMYTQGLPLPNLPAPGLPTSTGMPYLSHPYSMATPVMRPTMMPGGVGVPYYIPGYHPRAGFPGWP